MALAWGSKEERFVWGNRREEGGRFFFFWVGEDEFFSWGETVPKYNRFFLGGNRDKGIRAGVWCLLGGWGRKR